LVLVLRQHHIKVLNSYIYAVLQGNIIGTNHDFKEPLTKEGDIYVPGGFVMKNTAHFREVHFGTYTLDFDQSQFDAFERILKMLEDRGIESVLIQAPIVKELSSAYTNYHEFDDRMREYGVYYNFGELLELSNRQHFYDPNHLNLRGVEVFNTNVIEVLKQDGVLALK